MIALLYHIGKKLVKSPVYAMSMAVLAGMITIVIYCWRKFRERPLHNTIIWVGVWLTVIFACLFISRNDTSLEPLSVATVQTHYYLDRGIFTEKAYMEYRVTPTALAEPDKQYMVTISNNLVRLSDTMRWSELELAINKPLLFRREITRDELTALTEYPVLNKSIASFHKEHNALFVIIPILYWGAAYFLMRKWKLRMGVFHEVCKPIG